MQIVTDGFASMSGDDGYMTRYSRTAKDESSPEVPLTTIVAKLKAKGLKLGVYDSPFWYHYTNPNAVIPGTDGIKVSSLAYDPAKDKDINPSLTGKIIFHNFFGMFCVVSI